MSGDDCIVCGGSTHVERAELVCDACGCLEEECECEAALVED